MYDLVRWFMLPSVSAGFKLPNGQPYGIETHHLEGMNLTNNTKTAAYHNDTGKSFWVTKSKKGYPWDIRSYDDKWICAVLTESNLNGWTNPKNFKTEEKWTMLPRYWNGDPSVYVFHESGIWRDFQNCVQATQGNVGPLWYTIEGPFQMDHAGDVGVAPTILVSYYWSDGKHREQLFLTSTAGWQEWTHATKVSLSPGYSNYVIDINVNHNKIVPGVITPQFDCYQIP